MAPKITLVRFNNYQPLYNYSAEEQNGSLLAERFLVEALTRCGVVSEVLELDLTLEGSVREKKKKSCASMPSEVTVIRVSLAHLEEVCRSGIPILGLGWVGQIPLFAALRSALRVVFPICGVIHAIPAPYLISTFTSVVTSMENFDSIVVSSRSGYVAIERILAGVREILGASSSSQGILKLIPLVCSNSETEPLQRDWCRVLLEIQPHARVGLYVGRLTRTYKADLEPLLRILCRVRSKINTVRLIIAGHEAERDYYRELQMLCKELELEDAVSFVLDFPGWTRTILYGAADFLIAPSDNLQETFGLSVLEAMQSGLPVIAANWSGYKDLVEHNVSGILVDTWIRWGEKRYAAARFSSDMGLMFPREIAKNTILHTGQLIDAITRLAEDEALCSEMGRNARARYEGRFSEEVVAEQYRSLWIEQTNKAASSGVLPINRSLDPLYIFDDFPSSERDLEQLITQDPESVQKAAKRGRCQDEGLPTITIKELLEGDDELALRSTNLLKRGVLPIS